MVKEEVKKIEEEKLPIGVLYIIKDKSFGKLEIKKPRYKNTWWNERIKVEKLIEAYKLDATRPGACAYAGITVVQHKYFEKMHPDFCPIIPLLKKLPGMKARMAIVRNLDDPKLALSYLERREPGQFAPTNKHKHEGTLTIAQLLKDIEDGTKEPKGQSVEDGKPVQDNKQRQKKSPVQKKPSTDPFQQA